MPAARPHSVPAAAHRLVQRTPGAILLEGAHPDNSTSEEPWTQLFTAPLHICAAYQPDQVPALFAAIESALAAGQTAAGFFTYECAAAFEPKAGMRPPPSGMPLAWFGIYERGWEFDRERGTFAGGGPPELAAENLDDQPAEPPPAIDSRFGLDLPEYTDRIAAIHEWIRAGHVYQLNFTAPWQVRAAASAAALYACLRQRQPAAYSAFLHWQQGRHILCFSPELFFRIDGSGENRRIVTRPMKGTAPRGRFTAEDRALAGPVAVLAEPQGSCRVPGRGVGVVCRPPGAADRGIHTQPDRPHFYVHSSLRHLWAGLHWGFMRRFFF